MKNKLIQFIPALLALMAIGFRYFSNWCIDSASFCYGTWVHQIALSFTKPLYFFSLFFLSIAIILIFISRSVFNSWFKLAVVAIPLALIFIFTTHVSSNAYIDFFPFYRDDAARLSGEIFAVMSIIVLIFGFIRSHLYVKNAGQNAEEVEGEIRELKTVCAAIVGLISLIIFFWLAPIPSIDLFGVILLSGAVSIVANLYALWHIGILLYRKKRNHVSLGRKLTSALVLLGANIVIAVVWAVILNSG